ncbi:hypothetical protein HMPREF9349_05302, partial [Escherichia coli MS 79-10]
LQSEDLPAPLLPTNANHGFVTGEFAQMFQDVTGKRVRQGGERFFNCLNGIRRIHTCIPGEKRQNPAHRKGGGGFTEIISV